MSPAIAAGSGGAALIRRMAEGDRAAFAEFYDGQAPLAFALIRRILGPRTDAEEVLQEVFWQIWQEASTYREDRGSPEAWVLIRARSRAIDRLRSLRRREETFRAPLNDDLPPAVATTSPAERAADRTLVETALARLPDAQRQVIAMAFYEGLTQSEIARRLGEPLGTVKTRMRAGLDRLRGHLGAGGAPRP